MLKNQIKSSLPNCSILLSNIVERFDNAKAALTIKNLNEHLSDLALDVIENYNIDRDCLAKKGLHLNKKGLGRLAINFLTSLRSCNK